MKLNRLNSIAYNALRGSIWTPKGVGAYAFEHIRPRRKITIDLITGKLTPDMKGDDVEKYYKVMSEWFHQVLKKEGIPLNIIESAEIIITPEKRQCIIRAQGRIFTKEKYFS